jgi:hypothetical protein
VLAAEPPLLSVELPEVLVELVVSVADSTVTGGAGGALGSATTKRNSCSGGILPGRCTAIPCSSNANVGCMEIQTFTARGK